MRIGIDATTIYTPRPTGLGVYTINMVNELARMHDDLVVWTVDDSMLDVDPGRVRRVMQPFRFLGNHLFQLRAVWVETVLPALVRKERIDVLYTTIPTAMSRPPIPQVVTVHDLIPLKFPEDAPRTVRLNFRYRLPGILARSAAVIAVSDFTRRDVLEAYDLDPGKVTVVGEGYEEHLFGGECDVCVLESHGLEAGGYYLYVGNASARKNLPRLIRAFAAVASRIPGDLVLAGSKSPSERGELESAAAKAGIQGRVRFLDYVPRDHLPSLLSGSIAFVFPSLYEGFGLPVLEALACGAVVVAAHATSIPEVAGDAALYVDPTDEKSMAEALLRAHDPDLRQILSRRGRERCRMFDWKDAARRVLAVIASSSACQSGNP